MILKRKKQAVKVVKKNLLMQQPDCKYEVRVNEQF